MKNITVPSLIVCGLLALAFARMPYGYYTFLRIATCAWAIFASVQLHKLRPGSFMVWLSVAVAILYNPVFRIYLNRDIWQVINAVTIVFALVVLMLVRVHQNPEQEPEK